MSKPKNVVCVNVEYFTGQDEGDDGTPYFVASCDDLMFTTEGGTFEDLVRNVYECLILCLRDADSIAEYGVSPDARIKLGGLRTAQCSISLL